MCRLVRSLWLITAALQFALVGCGPTHGPPKVVLATPNDMPAQWEGRQLVNTPNACIYAHSPAAAGEADRWVGQVREYIKRNHHRELEKGIVIVMEPTDRPLARNLDEEYAMENDPALLITKPRHIKTPDEIRKRMEQEGIPEEPTAAATPLPLTSARLQSMGLPVGDAVWAMSGPSHQLASQSGIEVMTSALRKKNPNLTQQKAHDAVSRMPDLAAKPFEMTRAQPIFIFWVQRQKDWSDDQRRQAILKYIKHVLRENWLPVPSDEELGW
jgi:hypothetical protein